VLEGHHCRLLLGQSEYSTERGKRLLRLRLAGPVSVYLPVGIIMVWILQGIALCEESKQVVSASTAQADAAYQEGMKLLRAGQYSKALQEFDLVEKYAPRLPNGASGQGIALALMGKTDEAVDAFKRALSLDPSYWVARRELGIIYWEKHLPDLAAQELRPILQLFPDDASVNSILGQYEFGQRHYKEAIALLAKPLKVEPQPQIALMYAEALLNTGRKEAAGDVLKPLMVRGDLSANQGFLLGWLLGRAQLYEEAIQVLSSTPGGSPDLFSHKYGLALAYFLAGKNQDSIAILTDLVRQGEKRPELFALLGTAYEKGGNLLQAYNAFREGIIDNPENSLNYLNIGALAAQHRNYDLAVEMLTSGVERIHADYRLYLSRGIGFSLEGKLLDARKDYLKAIEMAPQDPQTSLALGLNYLDADQIDDAVAIFERTAGQGFEDPRPYYFFEQALLRKGLGYGSPNFGRASEAIATALSIDPNFVWGYVERGRLDLMQGKTEDAISDLEHARSLDPHSGTISYLLARAYQRKGDKKTASELFAQVEESNRQEAERVQEKNMLTIMVTNTPTAGQTFDEHLAKMQ
jgi:tetratricopeptide (TPR) repeat protein